MSTELSNGVCIPCSGAAKAMTLAEAEASLMQLPDWSISLVDDELRLHKAFRFANFVEAMTFTNAVADIAEANDHHPLMAVSWGCVEVSWWTHKIGGLHHNDFVMAAKTDGCLSR